MIKVLDIFSGIGTTSLALKELNVDFDLTSVEWDINAILIQAKYNANINEGLANYEVNKLIKNQELSLNGRTPAKKVKLTELQKKLITSWTLFNHPNIKTFEIKQRYDIMVYSFPCQGLSSANLTKDKGIMNEKSKSHIVWEVIRILKGVEFQKRPRVLIMENVPTLTTTYKKEFEAFLEQLEQLGYQTKYEVLNSYDYNSIQQRKRVFAISFLSVESFANYRFNKPQKALIPKNILRYIDFEASESKLAYQIKDTPSRRKIIEKAIEITPKTTKVRTITTKQDRLPNAGIIKNDINVPFHTNYRYLTTYECFLLMEIPSDYIFNNIMLKITSNTALYRLAGNGIVLNVMKQVLKDVLEVLD